MSILRIGIGSHWHNFNSFSSQDALFSDIKYKMCTKVCRFFPYKLSHFIETYNDILLASLYYHFL